MFASPRIPLKPLVGLCRRMSTALEAGIDLRTVCARETDRASGPLRSYLLAVSQAVEEGESLAEGVAATGEFFPALFRELIALGEQTGQLDAVLAQLADHYQNQIEMRRIFRAIIIWPMVQLGIAVAVVGFVIWVMGVIPQPPGNKPLDPLGLGLVGNRGLAIYVAFLACVGVLFWLTRRAVGRGLVWTMPIQRLVLQLPGIGKPLQTLALARLAWSMRVTFDAGMDVRHAMKLSLRSTRNARYIDHIPLIDAEITKGHSVHEAFCQAGGYPEDFLDTLAVGEQSGRLVESMGLLARQYQDQARAALAVLAMMAGWAIWAAVAGLIIVLIFRMFSFYLHAIGV
jgi:type II secretory pathway component PulF